MHLYLGSSATQTPARWEGQWVLKERTCKRAQARGELAQKGGVKKEDRNRNALTSWGILFLFDPRRPMAPVPRQAAQDRALWRRLCALRPILTAPAELASLVLLSHCLLSFLILFSPTLNFNCAKASLSGRSRGNAIPCIPPGAMGRKGARPSPVPAAPAPAYVPGPAQSSAVSPSKNAKNFLYSILLFLFMGK